MSKQVDAVIGAFRNFELNQLKLEKAERKAFFPEIYGVPKYDERIVVANKNNASSEKYKNFVKSLQEATKYLKENKLIKSLPNLDDYAQEILK